jgi:hypothetical protein
MRTSHRAMARAETRRHGCTDRVNCDGQLYTIEGIAAGLIMIMTAYLVVSATSVYTAGDTHINDMQLEQLGNDALKVMDTPETMTAQSELQMILKPASPDVDTFKTTFLNLVNGKAGSGKDHIQYTASYSCRNTSDNSIASYPLGYSRNLTGGEHAVRATKWVIVNKGAVAFCGTTNTERAVLVEVLMWRD